MCVEANLTEITENGRGYMNEWQEGIFIGKPIHVEERQPWITSERIQQEHRPSEVHILYIGIHECG